MKSAVLAAVLLAVAAQPAVAVVLPSGFETEREVSGLTRATAVAWAPDGRRFVAEKDGRLKVSEPGGTTARTILDIRADVNNQVDRGLLGLAVDADFPSQPYVYLLYTYDVAQHTTVPGPDSTAPTVSQLLRVTIGPGSQALDSEVILGKHTSGPCPPPDDAVDCIPSDSTTHSIGTVLSASDGTLFVGSGDGAGPTVDPRALRAYDERSMAGKLLRIDRNGRGVPGHPFCPAETDLTLVCTKLYAKGLRNPFRFTQLSDGGLFVGDVGWRNHEEIDVIPAGGGNYGWPCYEGPIRTPGWRDTPECQVEYAKEGTPDAALAPAYHYARSAPSAAVVAGPQYTGEAYPAEYAGRVFWGDYGAGFLRTAGFGESGALGPMGEFGQGWTAVDLKTAPNGDLAWVDVGDWGAGTASVERMIYTPGNRRPTAVAAADPDEGDVPLTVEFDASGSTDPDGDELTYRWDFADGSAPAGGALATHTYTEAGTYLASLTVTDARGRAHTDAVEINASNSPPVPRIDLPSAGFLYRNDAPVRVEGGAGDAEDGPLPGSSFDWSVRLVHHDHEHTLENPVGVGAFEFDPVRDHDADSHYAVRLTVTDSGGATRSVERTLHPATVPLRLRSVPSGAPLSYAGAVAETPWDTLTVVGFVGTLTAPQTYVSRGVEREFAGWSSGAPRVHDLSVPANPTELTAFYNATPVPVAEAARTGGAAPLKVTLDASASSDPDGEELTFRWDPGDGAPILRGARAEHTYRAGGRYTASVTVSDPRGRTSTEMVRITVEPDLSGPAIRAWRPRPGARVLAGLVRDRSGVAAMQVAVARIEGRGRCRRIHARPLRLAGAAPCERRRWLDAAVERRRWRVKLPRSLPPGRYVAWLRGHDSAGNVSRLAVDGTGTIRFTVSPAAARVP